MSSLPRQAPLILPGFFGLCASARFGIGLRALSSQPFYELEHIKPRCVPSAVFKFAEASGPLNFENLEFSPRFARAGTV